MSRSPTEPTAPSNEAPSVSYQVTINNPVGATSEESLRHVLRRQAYLMGAV